MTIEEKREAIHRWCHNWKDCKDCPYDDDETAWCQHKFLQELSDEEINQLYNDCIGAAQPHHSIEEIRNLAESATQKLQNVYDKIKQERTELKFYRWYIMQNDLMWDCLSKYQEWKEKNG